MSRLQILAGLCTLGNVVHQQKFTCIGQSYSAKIGILKCLYELVEVNQFLERSSLNKIIQGTK